MENNITEPPAPQAPKLTEVRHDLTDAQMEAIQPVLAQLGQLQNQMTWFINYITKEAKLPTSVDGYNLAVNQQTGKPYVLGHVPDEGK